MREREREREGGGERAIHNDAKHSHIVVSGSCLCTIFVNTKKPVTTSLDVILNQ